MLTFQDRLNGLIKNIESEMPFEAVDQRWRIAGLPGGIIEVGNHPSVYTLVPDKMNQFLINKIGLNITDDNIVRTVYLCIEKNHESFARVGLLNEFIPQMWRL